MDQWITKTLSSDVPLIETIAHHMIHSGGKRIRPLLCLVCAQREEGESPEASYLLAAAVEFIHTATLLHDDVIDDSPLRRGVPAAHRLWGNTSSILVGDYLFARAFELMVHCQDLRILALLSKVSSLLAEGEMLQLTQAYTLEKGKIPTALRIMDAKTGSLFGASCHAGALAGGRDQQTSENLGRYGEILGRIFQIGDDVLDYICPEKSQPFVPGKPVTPLSFLKRGKALGDDFREKKVTLPLLYAYEHANISEKKIFERYFSESARGKSQRDENVSLDALFEEMTQRIRDNGGFEACRTQVVVLEKESHTLLSNLPDPLASHLFSILNYAVNRF